MGFLGAVFNNTTNETETQVISPSATEVIISDLQAGGGGIAAEPGKNKTGPIPPMKKGGILICYLFTGIPVMLITVKLLIRNRNAKKNN